MNPFRSYSLRKILVGALKRTFKSFWRVDASGVYGTRERWRRWFQAKRKAERQCRVMNRHRRSSYIVVMRLYPEGTRRRMNRARRTR